MTRPPLGTKMCPACGEVFNVPTRHPEQIYCCRACYWLSKADVKSCPVCAKQFHSQIPKQIYCSRICYEASRQAATETVVCEGCGKKFTKRRVRNKRYCSLACANLNHAYPPHKHRKSKLAARSRGSNWVRQRRAAKRRDGYKCQICGRDVRKLQRNGYGVHHIVPYKVFNGDYEAANQLTNLITLCRGCHDKVEYYGYPCPQPLL